MHIENTFPSAYSTMHKASTVVTMHMFTLYQATPAAAAATAATACN